MTLQRRYDDYDHLKADLDRLYGPLDRKVVDGGQYINLTRFGQIDTKSAFYSTHLGLDRGFYLGQVVDALPMERLCKQLMIDVTAVKFPAGAPVYQVWNDQLDADHYLILTPLKEPPASPPIESK